MAISRVFSKSFSDPGPDKGILIVKRDEGIYGGACATKVYINALHAANIRPGEKVTLYVPAGKVIVSAEPSGICAGALVEESITITSGQTLSLRYGYGVQGDVFLTETAF
ncbi:hypothetical protein GCM10007291_37740 [Gemmobacter nanjingensis]|uniref:Uncharacterized protein n=1 Tax=Gemmobacter nanjingensis TaxID=488454 RepID=A0ABQ3FQ87_9RHOB|nr:hypothetical protein GCM10007291_37740 [Gemmobacter nanjingensis]